MSMANMAEMDKMADMAEMNEMADMAEMLDAGHGGDKEPLESEIKGRQKS